jgi:hypothetical protein
MSHTMHTPATAHPHAAPAEVDRCINQLQRLLAQHHAGLADRISDALAPALDLCDNMTRTDAAPDALHSKTLGLQALAAHASVDTLRDQLREPPRNSELHRTLDSITSLCRDVVQGGAFHLRTQHDQFRLVLIAGTLVSQIKRTEQLHRALLGAAAAIDHANATAQAAS